MTTPTARGFLSINKKHKTFLDYWIKSSNQLSVFTEEWRYHRLNIVEKILLSKKLKKPRIDQEIQHLFQTLPRDRNQLSRIFDNALQNESLSTQKSSLQKSLQKKKAEYRGRAGRKMPSKAALIMNDSQTANHLVNGIISNSSVPAMELVDSVEDEFDAFSAGESNPFANDPLGSDLGIDDIVVARSQMKQYYREIGPVKEWAENNYYKLPIQQQIASLITVNAFWRDYAAHRKGPFISTNLAEATKNFTEMMYALAVLDLPFNSHEVKVDFKDNMMQITPASDLVLFHREVDAVDSESSNSVLVKQQFFDFYDRYKNNGNEKIEKYISREFLTGRVYGAKIIVSNTKAQRAKLEILQQIPAGAIPLNNSQNTMTSLLTLQPYATKTMEYYFYFPVSGTYKHFPVHASEEGKLSSFKKPFTFKVVDEATEIDKSSWNYISQHGNSKDVEDFLTTANLNLLDLSLAFWRLKDKQFCSKFLNILKNKNHYNHHAYSYSLKCSASAEIGQLVIFC